VSIEKLDEFKCNLYVQVVSKGDVSLKYYHVFFASFSHRPSFLYRFVNGYGVALLMSSPSQFPHAPAGSTL
jgi:hypothetical protein